MGKLDAKAALITGAGSGIGRATAILFAQEGAKVAAIDVDQEGVAGAVTEITKASIFYPADEYYQDYLQKNPHGYNCHYLRD